jgi:GT2 family glycosyltransferase
MSLDAGLVSVIVVNWNGLEYVPECLESVLRQRYGNTELIVVDNASTDGSLEWLRTRASIGLIELQRNTGFAGGVNAGVRSSRGELIALLNSDAVAEPDWLQNLVAETSDPAIGMVASKILFYDRRDVIDKAGHLLYPDGLNRGRGAGETDRGQFDVAGESLFPDGCAALYRRSMLDDVGLFDEQFFAYGDDADLGMRARWRGWLGRYAPGARVYHRHSSSLGKYSPRKAYLVERNRVWLAFKLFPLPLLALTPFLTFWRFCWHARSIVSRRGLAGGVAREHSAARLFSSLIRAYASAAAGLPQILRKRRQVFAARKLSNRDFYRLLRRFRIPARELALRD